MSTKTGRIKQTDKDKAVTFIRIAVYMRLSKTDETMQEESNSISMQRILIRKYIASHFAEYEVMEYQDNGFTGTNFNRPGVQRLLEDARNEKFDCVVVKDFSRFGRDYMEVGSYLEQIFPLMEVRYISVNDHYDSEGVLGTAGGLNVAFKNLINMLYSRDLSKKIRSAQMARARKGEYLGGFARYGYEKSLEDKHRLVVDPEAAEVVRKIFTMAAEGVTISGIVRYLNDNGVLTCVEYKQRKDSRYQHPGGGVKKLWGPQSVRSILSDETYIGKVVWNRSEKSITTGKRMLWHDRSEWVVVDGQHEPLVSEELFALANERAKPKKRDRSGVDMSGFKREVLFVCGYCGRSMVKKNHKYCCRYRTCGTDTECRRAVEDMEKLEGSVMEYVRKTAEVMLGNSRQKDVEAERETLGRKLESLRREKEQISAEKMFLYDKYRSGGMTREQFVARTGSMGVRVDEIGIEMEEAEDRIEGLKGCGSQEGEAVLEGIAALREFDKGVLRKGIERIRVFGEGRIEVVWKGGDMFGGGDS